MQRAAAKVACMRSDVNKSCVSVGTGIYRAKVRMSARSDACLGAIDRYRLVPAWRKLPRIRHRCVHGCWRQAPHILRPCCETPFRETFAGCQASSASPQRFACLRWPPNGAFDLRRNALPEFNKRLRGAVVRLEHDVARTVALLELVDTFDACALEAATIAWSSSPTAMTLGCSMPSTQQVDYAHLRAVGVLELVDLDVAIGVPKALLAAPRCARRRERNRGSMSS